MEDGHGERLSDESGVLIALHPAIENDPGCVRLRLLAGPDEVSERVENNAADEDRVRNVLRLDVAEGLLDVRHGDLRCFSLKG
jgi:hypothetical protein